MNGPFDELDRALRHGPDRIGQPAGRRPRGLRRAGVLLLFTEDGDPALTFIQRAHTLRNHAGQIAFPGGGLEEGDRDVTEAALREAEEEVGFQRDLARVLGRLPVAWVPKSGYDVTPVIATWAGEIELTATDPAEVHSVHSFRVSELSDPSQRVSGRHPGGYVGPAFVMGDLFIWGFTGHLVDLTLTLAGWERPWDAKRVVDVPSAFLRD